MGIMQRALTKSKSKAKSGKRTRASAGVGDVMASGVNPAMPMGGSTGFDAADYSRHRAWVSYTPSGRDEVSSYVLDVIRLRCKVQRNCLAHIRFLENVMSRHCIGLGLIPIPITSDEDWNEAAGKFFFNWATNASMCDTRNRQTFFELQKMIPGLLISQGETFVVKARGETGGPQFQVLDVGDVAGTEGVYRDGIGIDDNGRKIGYRIPLRSGGAKTPGVNDVCQIGVIERPEQYHSLPEMYSAANDSQDLLEALAALKAGVKAQMAIALAITSSDSAVSDVNKAGVQLVRHQISNPAADSAVASKILEDLGGYGTIARLNQGDELKSVSIGSNSELSQPLMKQLATNIAYSCGLNPGLLLSLADLNSGGVRAVWEDFGAWVVQRQQLINDKLTRPFYVWVVASAMNAGLLPRCKDKEWWNVAFQGPAKLNINTRSAKESIDLMNAGLLSMSAYRSMLGDGNWRSPIRQRVREIAFELAECKAMSVPYSIYRVIAQGGAPVDVTTDAAPDEPAPKEAPAKTDTQEE